MGTHMEEALKDVDVLWGSVAGLTAVERPVHDAGIDDVTAAMEAVLQGVLQVAAHSTAAAVQEDVVRIAAHAIAELHAADADTTEGHIVSIVMQLVQTPSPPANAPAQLRSHTAVNTCFARIFSLLPSTLRDGVLWAYLYGICTGTSQGSSKLYTHAQRVSAVRMAGQVFEGDPRVVTLLSSEDGVLYDASVDVRRGALQQAALLLSHAKLPSDALLHAVRALGMGDPAAQVRRLATQVFLTHASVDAHFVAHRTADKDKPVRVATLRHLVALPPARLVELFEVDTGGVLPEALARALASADATETRLAGSVVSALMTSAQDLTLMLVRLDVCSRHSVYEQLLVDEITASIEAQ